MAQSFAATGAGIAQHSHVAPVQPLHPPPQPMPSRTNMMPGGATNDVLRHLASGFGQPASSIPQPDRTMGLPPELMSTPQPTLPPASTPTPNPVTGGLGDLPVNRHGPTLGSGQGMSRRVDQEIGQRIGTTRVSNPTLSQTDDVVNRIHEAERNLKDVRRDQWLEMNRASASNVLASIGSELPSHLAEVSNPANAKALADRLSTPNPLRSGPDPALMQRMAEVAVRQVARKRGVTVETPSARIEGENATVTVTYIDDGRVLDDPETLRSAFERAVTTELALKGMDVTVSIDLSRQKDGAVESLVPLRMRMSRCMHAMHATVWSR